MLKNFIVQVQWRSKVELIRTSERIESKYITNFLGLNKFNLLSNYSRKDVIALGGVSKQNIKVINLTKSIGFAGISYFRQKKGPYKGASFKICF